MIKRGTCTAALVVLLAFATALSGDLAEAAWDGGVLKRKLTATLAFDAADRYQDEVFNEGAHLEPCMTRDNWDGRFLCNLVFPATAREEERTYPLWVYKHRGHVCVFDPSDEPGATQCVPPEERPGAPRTVARFKLTGANGYALEIERFDRRLTVRVSRGSGSASYELAAQGPPSTNGVAARVPGLLDIAVRFMPTTKTELLPKGGGCSYNVTRHTRGVFVGRIRFEGEQEYTRVDASRASGTVNHRVRSRCRPGGRTARTSGAEADKTVEVDASLNTAGRLLEFNCAKGEYPLFAPPDYEGRNRRFFLAELFENGKAVDVVRKVELTGPPSTFVVDDALTKASISPPAPFEGSAELEQEEPTFLVIPEPTWAGSLAVSFPGAAHTPLVGPDFAVRLSAN